MSPEKNSPNNELRRQAEEQLKAQKSACPPELEERRRKIRGQESEARSQESEAEADTQQILHDLRVHQVELEMQNEELQKNRAEIKAAAEKYADLYDFAPAGYFSLNSQGEITQTNLAGAGLLNMERALLVGKRFAAFVAEADRSTFHSFLQLSFSADSDQTCVVELDRKDQPPVVLQVTAAHLVNGEGCRIAVADITERKQAEEALAKSEARFRGTFENAALGIAHVGQDGCFLEVNETLCQIIGYSREELIQKTFQEIIYAADLEKNLKLFTQLNAGEIPTYTIEKRYLHRDGRIIWIQNTAAMQNDKNGEPLYCISLIRDICKEKEMALSLEKAMVMAEASNIAKSQFISNMSHELRTPLNPIIGLSDLLLEMPDDKDQVLEFSEIINNAGVHMLHLHVVESILDFSKIKAGKMTLSHEWFELNAPFEKASSVLSGMCLKKGLELNQKMESPCEIEIESDASALLQVAINLIGNAIKFTDSGSVSIQVSFEPKENDDGTLLFSVKDTGIGISEEDQERIWSSFERVDNTISSSHEGAGLGLAISLLLVEKLNGSIQVESSLGKGTTFTVMLPVKYRLVTQAIASEKTCNYSGLF